MTLGSRPMYEWGRIENCKQTNETDHI